MSMIGMEQEPDPTDKAPEDRAEGESYTGPEFTLPPSYTPPDNAQLGEDVSVLCKMRIKDGGKACLVSVDGAKFDKAIDQSPKPEVKVDNSSQLTENLPIGDRLKSIRKQAGAGY